MTANELVSKLDEIYTGTDYEEIKLAATMLRKQAEQIELLQNDIVKQQEFVCQQQAEIKALKCVSGNILINKEIKD